MKKLTIIIAALFLAMSCNETAILDHFSTPIAHVSTAVAIENELEQRSEDYNPFINQKAVADLVYLMTEGDQISNLFHSGEITVYDVHNIYDFALDSYPTQTAPEAEITINAELDFDALMVFLTENHQNSELIQYFTDLESTSNTIDSISSSLVTNGYTTDEIVNYLHAALLAVQTNYTTSILQSRSSDPCSYCHTQYNDNMAAASDIGWGVFTGAMLVGTAGAATSGGTSFFVGLIGGALAGSVMYGVQSGNARRTLQSCLEEFDCENQGGGNSEDACSPGCRIHSFPR